MRIIQDWLFLVWLLLLPFSWLISINTVYIAPDKFLSPILIATGLLLLLRLPLSSSKYILMLSTLVLVFILLKNISFVGDNALYWELMWEDLIKVGYFIIPLLCITSMRQFCRASWVVVIVAILGCVTVFLAAVGFLTLPIERFESSRLGIEGLEKAIGLFVSYGDLAQYLVFSLFWVLVLPGIDIRAKKKLRYLIIRIGMFISIFFGLLGSQSRNVLLSIVLALLVYWVYKKYSGKQKNNQMAALFGLISFGLLGFGLIGFYMNDIYSMATNLGGTNARNTAGARLEQYLFAIDVFFKSPFFGADLETYKKMEGLIEYIHNMWLRLAAHGGLFAVIPMLMLFSYVFVKVKAAADLKEKSEEILVLIPYFFVLIFASMFYVAMGELFWALLGVAASYAVISEPKTSNNVRSN